MDIRYLTDTFEREGLGLDTLIRRHPLLAPLFTRNFRGVSIDALRGAYLQLLKLKADYVQYTVPALRAAGEALRGGDGEDRQWSAVFLDYANGETDEAHPDGGNEDYGHHVWARNDMIALGAPEELLAAPTDPTAVLYGQYFVEGAARHPYAVLGAKGVLERFSLRVSDDLVGGLIDSGIPNAARATQFFEHHGVLDIDHVRQGDRNLAQLAAGPKRNQILEGVYVTTGHYRALVHHLLPV
ncbi:MAG TPA: iron-containing redox enzyme family protein [Kofleriaceae bacterium]